MPPTIGCWFWGETEFKPGACFAFLDLVGNHAAYNLLTTTLRVPDLEVTSQPVHDQIKAAAIEARRRGMNLVMDLDVRLARAAFQRAFPDEMQEMLRLREVLLPAAGETNLTIASEVLSDHYTARVTPYVPLQGRLVRVYSYVRSPAGIDPASILELTRTSYQVIEASSNQVRVTLAGGPSSTARHACVLAAFTLFTPDVFAPHLLSFQRQILARYADVPLAGVCKDEWGFPPCYDGNPAKNDFWYSRFMHTAYSRKTHGRDLVRDALLMSLGELGRAGERQAAINHYMELCLQRNGAIESDFYLGTKATFGPAAVSATHPTWWPYPDSREFKKNGLDWWIARRDLAQTDEVTPYCVRTALAKKWGSPVWYNMYYSSSVADYERSLWSSALAGGRINYHPAYPYANAQGWSHEVLLKGGLTRGDCRIRLLNFISDAPLDCPVAVVFGHAGAMNWAGPGYDDVGMELANHLWQAGYYADLIPTSEIANGSLRLGKNRDVYYGAQRYAAVVLYRPEFERQGTAAFFQRAAKGRTALFRVGEWTTDFDGRPVPGNSNLPKQMTVLADAAAGAARVIAHLRGLGLSKQEPAIASIGWDRRSATPPTRGRCHLIDGTQILLAGEKDVAGDPIQSTFQVEGHEVTFDARGVAAVRLAADGKVLALAAGGLRCFRAGALEILLDQPTDLALWRDRRGQFHGVVQGGSGPLPPALAALTKDWLHLAVPPPVK